jgi:hypothetical protein
VRALLLFGDEAVKAAPREGAAVRGLGGEGGAGVRALLFGDVAVKAVPA